MAYSSILFFCFIFIIKDTISEGLDILPPNINECVGINEEYYDCTSPCPLTCKNMYQEILCYAVCVTKCDCKQGYVRNSKNECVSPIECLPKEVICPNNQVFNNCYGCVLRSCSEINSATTIASGPACATVCNTGCLCKEPGYVIDDITNTGCILPKSCPPIPEKCGMNEIWNPCASSCSKTCGNMYLNEICDKKCNAKCDCIDGYVRNLAGECILSADCSENEIKCPFNQELNPCYSSCGTRTCSGKPLLGIEYSYPDQIDDPVDSIQTIRIRCLLKCVKGCGCANGYVWDDVHHTGCMPIQNCPPSLGCPLNELEDYCVEPCQPTCTNPYPHQCFYVWFGICRRGCVCKPPLVRDEINGQCVDRSYCESQCPGRNEVLRPCSGCERVTCANLNLNQLLVCNVLCAEGSSVCDCKDGYVFDEVRNECVPDYLCNCPINK